MAAITATELELLECLGAEPTLADPGIPWCYNEAAYKVEVDGLSVSFTVYPSYRDIRLVVHRADSPLRPLYELSAIGVADVRVLDIPGCDIFEVQVTQREWLKVQLRPGFGITHGFKQLPPWNEVAKD